MTNIGDYAFLYCSELSSVTIGSGVADIGSYAFSGCSLTWITIPNGVTSIGSYAFSSCYLTSITIPNSVTNIGGYAFSGCSYLRTISIPVSLQGKTSNWGLPSNCQIVVRNEPQSYAIRFDSAGGTSVAPIVAAAGAALTAPTPPTKQGCAFAGWSPAFPLTMPVGGATLVAQWSEVDANGFIWTVSGNAVTITGFDGTPTGALVIPATINGYPVRTIGYGAFNACSGLTSVTIPDSVTSIGNYAFNSCSGLTSVTIPDSVTSIGEHAFRSCWNLKTITMGIGLKTSGSGAFDGTGLEAVLISDLSAWCSISFANLPANPCAPAQHLFLNGNEIVDLVIPEGVTGIGDYAFARCALTTVAISDSVTSIGKGAFTLCDGLTSIMIPDGVTSVGEDAFSNCSNLATISIPASLQGQTSAWGLSSGCQIVVRN